jgi:hypothetical protein
MYQLLLSRHVLSNVSGALTPSCIELPDPEDTSRHFRIGSHIWLTI